MTKLRIETIKGMNSTVVSGTGDAPAYAQDVVYTRDGGITPAPGPRPIASATSTFRQFASVNFAYYRTALGSYRMNLLTGASDFYPEGIDLRDTTVYGASVIESGKPGGSFALPKFGPQQAELAGESATLAAPPTETTVFFPELGGFGEVETVAYNLDMTVSPIIADISMGVTFFPASVTYSRTPTDAYSNFVYTGNQAFHTGTWRLVTVYFRRRKNFPVGTIHNPSAGGLTYLGNYFLVMLPAEPKQPDGTPIIGAYEPRFSFTGVPVEYEPVFFGFSANRLSGYSLVANKSTGAIAVGDTVFDNVNNGEGIWVAETAGTLTGYGLNTSASTKYYPGSQIVVDGITFKFVGPVETRNEYYMNGNTITDGDLYYYLTDPNTLDGPEYILADYISRVNPMRVTNSNTPYWRWRGLVPRFEAGTYRLDWIGNDDQNPPAVTFFPMGTKVASSSGSTWVAADYVIKSGVSSAKVTNRNAAFSLNTVFREYAKNYNGGGIRTLYYSRPNSFEFREDFLIPPLRRSYGIRAVAAMQSGIVVFGDADGCLISGDSPASFRATPLDIPGTISQFTVANYHGSLIYAAPDGLYVMDGGGASKMSNEVDLNWGSPISISLNEKDAALLISFSDRPALHYDLKRKAWSVWTTETMAIPVEAPWHTTAIIALDGTATIYAMDGLTENGGYVEYLIDGGEPGVRKNFEKVSYRRENVNTVTLSYSGAYDMPLKESSSRNDSDLNIMQHRINVHAHTLRMRLTVSAGAVAGGPITVDIKGMQEGSDLRGN